MGEGRTRLVAGWRVGEGYGERGGRGRGGGGDDGEGVEENQEGAEGEVAARGVARLMCFCVAGNEKLGNTLFIG